MSHPCAAQAFDALSDTSHLYTFSGGSSTDFAYDISQTAGNAMRVGYTATEDDEYDASAEFAYSIWPGRKLEARERTEKEGQLDAHLSDRRRRLWGDEMHWEGDLESSVTVDLGRSSDRARRHTHAVHVHLSDPEPSDFFALKIETDPYHGTPIFTTMGGVSRCPGETGTSKVDDEVTIAKLEYHCSLDSFAPSGSCVLAPLATTVGVGVVVQNLSPAKGPVATVLTVGAPYDAWRDGHYAGSDYCGQGGRSQGLVVAVDGANAKDQRGVRLDALPYGQTEVLLALSESGVDAYCHEYNDVPVRIASACESETEPYQYRTALDASASRTGLAIVHPTWNDDAGAFDADTRPVGVAGDEATFSVSWDATSATARPTRAPTRAIVSFLSTLALTIDGMTATAYCDAYDDLDIADLQAAIVEAYVTRDWSSAALPSAPDPACRAVGAATAAVDVSVSVYADVIDRDAGETFASFQDDLNTLLEDKAASGAWTADLRAALGDGRRLQTDAASFLAAASVDSVTTSATKEMAPTPMPTAPSDDDDDDASGIAPATLAFGAGAVIGAFLLGCGVASTFAYVLVASRPGTTTKGTNHEVELSKYGQNPTPDAPEFVDKNPIHRA